MVLGSYGTSGAITYHLNHGQNISFLLAMMYQQYIRVSGISSVYHLGEHKSHDTKSS